MKSKRSDDDERDKVVYVSPPPKTAAETRAWNRMSSRMEGESFLGTARNTLIDHVR